MFLFLPYRSQEIIYINLIIFSFIKMSTSLEIDILELFKRRKSCVHGYRRAPAEFVYEVYKYAKREGWNYRFI